MTANAIPMPSSNIVAVTGASGFIGLAVLAALERQGLAPRPLVRKLDRLPTSLQQHARVVDLQNAEQVAAALQGVAAIIHLAFDMRAPTSGQGHDVITRNVVAAAAHAQARLVLASSYSVIDWVRAGQAVDTRSATVSTHGPLWYGAYAHAKAAQEALTRQLCREFGVHVSILRPGKVWDQDHLPSDVIGPRIGKRQLVVRPGRQAQVIDVQTCADAFAKASQASTTEELLHLVDTSLITVEALAERLPETTHVLKVPGIFVLLLRAVSPLAALAFKAGLKVPGLLLWPRVEARYPLAHAPASHSTSNP